MKSLENAIDKECSTEKQIDEIAHHAHNNIQFLKKNSQEQIATFKKRAGDNFAMNAHAQKTQCNEEIKSHIINQINDHLYKFFVTHQANVGKKSCIENSLNKLENILNANDID
ncbi:hypothetical protein CAXC1_210001 [Candidatus Xenohaliotis californiensis]|uniref:Uncharacterized protein n=1 Tax=Candidatus Xenohaliotis californiensis TaxID=84677 RepID=A0ABM9N7Q3_9RICK|nr:hypothetical protein CAXC1_210001 [Candidatus Xenohaliotis californiensis]